MALKSELRKNILKQRMELTLQEVSDQSEAITKRFLAMPEFLDAKVVLFYLDFRNEVKTWDMIVKAMDMGKRVLVPITKLKEVKLIPSEIIDFPGDLVPGTWGILEPKPDCARPVAAQEIDFIAVPGVAFDTDGNRLGYGGGFYDRFNSTIRPDTTLAALAFEIQIQPNVYPEPHDHKVHYIITEDRLINCQ